MKAYVQGLRELEVKGYNGTVEYPNVLKLHESGAYPGASDSVLASLGGSQRTQSTVKNRD
jgi:hypothetical protein